jgi:LTXXQ motif family protein
MLQRKVCASFVVFLALVAAPLLAQQQQHEQHHPDTAPSAGIPQGMPGGGVPMMEMMRMMMGHSGGMGGMPMMASMVGHVEGRLAFLKTELKITEAQLPLRHAIADAIRANAKGMTEMMSGGMMGASQATTLPDKLTLEKMVTECLEAVRTFKTAVDPLYAALSDEQKKTG